MNVQQEKRPARTAPEDLGAEFWRGLEADARQQKVSVDDILAKELLSVSDFGTPTAHCLDVDEVDMLIASPNLRVVAGALRVRESAMLTPDESVAWTHATVCSFCNSMLALATPDEAARERFIAEILRPEIATSTKASETVDELMDRRQWDRLKSCWPILIPVSFVGVILYIGSATSDPSLFVLSLSAYAGVISSIGLIGAIAGLVSTLRRDNRETLPISRAATKLHASNIALRVAFAATTVQIVALLLPFAGAHQYSGAEAHLVESVRAQLTQNVDPTRRFSDLAACPVQLNEGAGAVCSTKSLIPGDLVASHTDTTAAVYWEVNGKKIRTWEFVKAIVKSENGEKKIVLPSGKSTPLRDFGKYKIGTSVIAAINSPDDTKRLQSQNLIDDHSSEFPIIVPVAYAQGK